MTSEQQQGDEGAETRVNILLPYSATGGADRRLVDRIVAALYDHPQTRAAILAAGGEAAAATPHYTSLDELEGMPPPPGAIFYNEAIGVLSVPAPEAEGVRAVKAALQDLAETVQIEPQGTFHTL